MMAREAGRPLDDNRIKTVLNKDNAIVKNWNEFSAVFTAEDLKQVPVPEQMFSGEKMWSLGK